jgi:hypothetical protein
MRHGQDFPAARIRRDDPPSARVRWLRADAGGAAPGPAYPRRRLRRVTYWS